RCYRCDHGIFLRSARVHNYVPVFCAFHCSSHAIRRRTLEAWRRIAWPRRACNLRLYHWPIFVAGRSEWGRYIECGPYALRTADASSGWYLGRSRRTNHNCRYDRRHACRLAAYGATATALGRLCFIGRLCADGACIELYYDLWRSPRTLTTEA